MLFLIVPLISICSSDATVEIALKEMKAGRSLCDTATAFNIPRTTLYMRARSCGVINPMQKLGYNKEQLQDAINAVKGLLNFILRNQSLRKIITMDSLIK
jgi:hypothetical protein